MENPPRQKEQKCFKLKHKFLRISTLINRLTWAAKCHAVDWVNSRVAGCNHDVWFFSLSEGNMSRKSGSCWQKSSLTSPQRQSRRKNKNKRRVSSWFLILLLVQFRVMQTFINNPSTKLGSLFQTYRKKLFSKNSRETLLTLVLS